MQLLTADFLDNCGCIAVLFCKRRIINSYDDDDDETPINPAEAHPDWKLESWNQSMCIFHPVYSAAGGLAGGAAPVNKIWGKLT